MSESTEIRTNVQQKNKEPLNNLPRFASRLLQNKVSTLVSMSLLGLIIGGAKLDTAEKQEKLKLKLSRHLNLQPTPISVTNVNFNQAPHTTKTAELKEATVDLTFRKYIIPEPPSILPRFSDHTEQSDTAEQTFQIYNNPPSPPSSPPPISFKTNNTITLTDVLKQSARNFLNKPKHSHKLAQSLENSVNDQGSINLSPLWDAAQKPAMKYLEQHLPTAKNIVDGFNELVVINKEGEVGVAGNKLYINNEDPESDRLFSISPSLRGTVNRTSINLEKIGAELQIGGEGGPSIVANRDRIHIGWSTKF